MRNCAQCKREFEVTDCDREFYQKIDVPEPTLCPSCRDRRRWASGNDLSLYLRACDMCTKQTIAMYSPNGPYVVYCNECWWSDKWDPIDYGRDFDFSRNFFEQFNELQQQVPRMATSTFNCERSPYVNNCGGMTNCYMCTSCGYCEDSFHLIWGVYNKDCSDSFRAVKNELCYELVNTNDSYHSAWLYQCEGMTESYFCYDCRNCSRCIFSSNLRGKELHIFNKPVTEQEYNDFVLTLQSFRAVEEYKQRWAECIKIAIHKNLNLQNCENVVGDNVSNSVNSYALFDSEQCENVRYSRFMFINTKDCMDISAHGDGCEQSYEGYGLGTGGVNTCLFTRQCCRGCSVVYYSDLCFDSHDLFGCVNTRKKSWCIFNKQYSQEEYMRLRDKLIAHMRKTGEYGEYFPGSLSPFGYNESSAMLYYPLVREEALRLGYRWSDDVSQTKGKETIDWRDVPDTIEECPRSLTDAIFACTQCGRNYKIIKQEFEFLQKMHLPLPRVCPQCRHAARIALRNPQTLWHRQCMCEKSDHDHNEMQQGMPQRSSGFVCQRKFETTYGPDRPELVYCETCYQKEVM